MNGIERIAQERNRQIVKGWTSEHDEIHTSGGLSVVAAILAVEGTDATVDDPVDRGDWGILDRWKEKEPNQDLRRIRLLEIAGALIAAEIDRKLANQPFNSDIE